MKDMKPDNKRYPFVSILDKLGLDLNNWDRRLTTAELQYMFDRFSHIQITTPNNIKLPAYNPPRIISSRSGWAVINYGNAISSSPGNYLFNYAGLAQHKDKMKAHPFHQTTEEDDEGGTDIGTITKQRFITAEDIVAEALENGWDAIHIVDGDPAFIWAVWAHAQEKGLAVTGYKFGKEEQERRERISRNQVDEQKARKGIKRSHRQ